MKVLVANEHQLVAQQAINLFQQTFNPFGIILILKDCFNWK